MEPRTPSIPLAAIQELTQHSIPHAMRLLETIHCRKTGQPIGTRSPEDMALFTALHGINTRQEALSRIELATQTSMAWLQTDTAMLDKLQQIDPRGFFCYCINICLIHRHQQTMPGNKRAFMYGMDGQRAFGNSLVQAYYQTSTFTPHELAEYGHLFRQFLFLDLHKSRRYKLPFRHLRVDDSWKEFYPANTVETESTPIPILPHEVVNENGKAWLRNNLKDHISELIRRARIDTSFYASITTNSQFRSNFNTSSLVEALNIDMNGIGVLDVGPLERLIRIQRQIEERRRIAAIPAPTHTLKATGMAGLVKLATAPTTYARPKTLGELIQAQNAKKEAGK